MAVTPSTMLPLGTEAPSFSLPNVDGRTVSRDDFKDSTGLLVVFMCNHCPYVKHVIDDFSRLAAEYQERGIAVVGISANDVSSFPEDAPDQMARVSKKYGFTFPYLYDEAQEVARVYHAACTPDFFLFDGKNRLYYRGQLDGSRPGNDTPITGEDLTGAVDALLDGKPSPDPQRPSMGCNIKWKPGKEPDYFKI
jgi:peroxiredoxin